MQLVRILHIHLASLLSTSLPCSFRYNSSTLHFCQHGTSKSTLIHYLTCSSRLHAFVEGVGSRSCAPLAQGGRSLFVAWWWRIEHFHRPASRPRSGPALQTSRRSKAVRLWRSLLRTDHRPAEPLSDSSCAWAADSRLDLWRNTFILIPKEPFTDQPMSTDREFLWCLDSVDYWVNV